MHFTTFFTFFALGLTAAVLAAPEGTQTYSEDRLRA